MNKLFINEWITGKLDGLTATERLFHRWISRLPEKTTALTSQLHRRLKTYSTALLALMPSVQQQQALTNARHRLKISSIAIAEQALGKASTQLNHFCSTVHKKTEGINTSAKETIAHLALSNHWQHLKASIGDKLRSTALTVSQTHTPAKLPTDAKPRSTHAHVEMKTENNSLTLVTPVLLQKKIAAPYFEHKQKNTKIDPNAAMPGPAMRILANSGNKTQLN